MKSLLLTLTGLGLGIGIGLSLNRPKDAPLPASEASVESIPAQPVDSSQYTTKSAIVPCQSEPPAADGGAATPAVTDTSNLTPSQQIHPNAVATRLAIDQAMQTILSPQATYQQKKDAWQHLKGRRKA